MNLKVFFISLCMFTYIPMKAQDKVEKIMVYKKFCRGGTSAMISYMFKHPQKPFVDTTNINVGTCDFLNEFNQLLPKLKPKKHPQKKIVEIEIAGEFWMSQSDKHFFIICSSNLLIDMTDKKEYRITDELLLSRINRWINCIRHERTNIPINNDGAAKFE